MFRTNFVHQVVVAALFGFALLGVACKSTSYSDLEYLAERIRVGDERALREVGRLESPEDQAIVIPALIDAYNSGLRIDDVVRILVDLGHPDGRDVFVSALNQGDNRLAGLAARGIAIIGSAEYAPQIASRLTSVRDPSDYEPFLAALRELPGDPSSAGPVADLLMRPAGRLGSINTVRMGCTILGQSGATDDATIDALVFSLVNFMPRTNQDASRECIRALVMVGPTAVPRLAQTFLGQNATVNDHVVSLGMTVEVAQLRAAKTLSDMADPAALETFITWLSTEHTVSTAELNAMSQEQTINWFGNFGQTYQFAIEYLGNVATAAEDDAAHVALRSLIARGEGMLLENFRQFMGTSDGAELGLRAAGLVALANAGDVNDRDRIFEIAMAGTLGRAPDRYIRQEATHAFALLSQAGDLARFDELINALDDNAQREEVEPYRAMVEVAEQCQGALDCLTERLDGGTSWTREKVAFDLAHFTEDGLGAASALLSHLDQDNIESRLAYIGALRRLPMPGNGLAQIEEALEEAAGDRFSEVRHALRILRTLKTP
jgi:hypothetical protein